MPTTNVSHGAAMRLRPGAPRARAFSGVVRFAPTPAYKLRRFAGEWSFRVHASSVRLQPVTSEGLDLGLPLSEWRSYLLHFRRSGHGLECGVSTPPNNPSCLGICCPVHAECARYVAAEGTPPTTIATCEEPGAWPLYVELTESEGGEV